MKLTADNLLQVAMEMERTGRTFYESLALERGRGEIAILATLRENAEKEHIETFDRIRDSLPPHQCGPRLTETELIAAAAVELQKIIPNARTVHAELQTTDLFKTLDVAIELEPEAVAMYSGLALDIVGLDKAALTDIISEEKEHLRKLREVRKLLST